MAFKVLGDKILVQRDPPVEDGPILIPNAVKQPPKSGYVLAVGPDVVYIKAGDHVYFSEYAGYFFKEVPDLDECDLVVMREDEVLVVEAPDE